MLTIHSVCFSKTRTSTSLDATGGSQPRTDFMIHHGANILVIKHGQWCQHSNFTAARCTTMPWCCWANPKRNKIGNKTQYWVSDSVGWKNKPTNINKYPINPQTLSLHWRQKTIPLLCADLFFIASERIYCAVHVVAAKCALRHRFGQKDLFLYSSSSQAQVQNPLGWGECTTSHVMT